MSKSNVKHRSFLVLEYLFDQDMDRGHFAISLDFDSFPENYQMFHDYFYEFVSISINSECESQLDELRKRDVFQQGIRITMDIINFYQNNLNSDEYGIDEIKRVTSLLIKDNKEILVSND